MGKENNMIKNINKKIKTSFIIVLFFCIFFAFSSVSYASTQIYFEKDVQNIQKGDIFYVNLKIYSEQEINVIDGTITYNKDTLELQKVDKENSLLSLWAQEPSFDNKTGELNFIGGVPEGFKGKAGQVLKITFLAKNLGNSMISFKDPFSILLNDGKGTSSNPSFGPISLSINEKSNTHKNYSKYLIFIVALVVLFSIIRLFIRLKNKKNGK